MCKSVSCRGGGATWVAAGERMKHLFGVIILSALIGTAACSEDSNRTDRIVVLDSWWSLDFAKNSCQQATEWYRRESEIINELGCNAVTSCQENMPRVNACVNDPRPEVLQFLSQLASDTQCDGVQVVQYDGPNSATSSAAANTMAKSRRTLIVDYTPGSPKQAWGLVSKSYH